ncbi:hypothetical protein [Candidatus Rhodoluna planktonica]|uniref:Type II secretion system protein GspF domain-containing protein n=1 Tax=Candidatus Rhodoluna planktonica TaxID=535712 RepID=A0A1D9DXZ8_9MICO|nr:hypothetical protein [Candidatus Rhodoluna planktonica]AOY55677.1 hypothetical protein A4Z71_01320 [Candidatus Rhodoluna planktonica]
MSGPDSSLKLTRLASLIEAGIPIHALENEFDEIRETLMPGDRVRLDLVLRVAKEKGSPIVFALRQIAEELEFKAQFEAQLELAFTAPKASTKIINRLPIALIGLVQFTGLANYFAALANPVMLIVILTGCGLLVTASRLSNRLIAKAQKIDLDDSDLLTIARLELAAGVHHEQVRVGAPVRFKSEHNREPNDAVRQLLDQSLDTAQTWGAAVDLVIRANQAAYRSARQNLLLRNAEQLSVKLLMPLGLIALPGFLIITVLPIAVAMLTN